VEETEAEVQNQLPWRECIKVFCALQEQASSTAYFLWINSDSSMRTSISRTPLTDSKQLNFIDIKENWSLRSQMQRPQCKKRLHHMKSEADFAMRPVKHGGGYQRR
jgi:hypothetical protein